MNKTIENRFPKQILNFAAISTILIIIIGLIGNSLTIYILLKKKKLQTSTAAFLGSLATSDIILCIFVLPFEVSKYLNGTWIHGSRLCSLIPMIRYGNVAVSLTSLAMISVNRYIQIAHSDCYPKCYSNKCNLILMIALSWILCYGSILPTFFGIWGTFGYDHLLNTCSINNDRYGHNPKKFLFFIAFVIPCTIIVFCYTSIYIIVRKSRLRLEQRGCHLNKRPNDLMLTRMVLCIFFAFLICYLPITISKLIDPTAKYLTLHIVGYILIYLSSCINPIIYVLMNQQYRKAYYSAISSCFRISCLQNAYTYGVHESINAKNVQNQTVMSVVVNSI